MSKMPEARSRRRDRRRRHRRRRPRRPVLRAEAGAAPGHRAHRGAARRRRLDRLGAGRHRRRGRRGRQRRKRMPPTPIAVGAGLVDEARRARRWRAKPPARIHDLLAYGVPFDRDLEGRLAVVREAAHSARRIVHVRGDMAGHGHHGGADRRRAQDAVDPGDRRLRRRSAADRGRRGHRPATAPDRRRRRTAA